EEYYRVLSEGVKGTNAHDMEVHFKGHKIDKSLVADPSKNFEKSDDYGPAIWNPADSSNYNTGRGGNSIDYWVNHWIGIGTYAGTISWFKNPSANVSSHFVVRNSDGQITQMVRIADTSWHAGNSLMNRRSIGVEHEAIESNPGMWNSMPMLEASATMCRYFTDLYGIPRTRSYIIGHNEVPRATTCPGPLPWDLYMSLVNADEGIGFRNRLRNPGFEEGTEHWVSPAATNFTVSATSWQGQYAGFISRADGYHTIWQNPGSSNGETWRASAWARILPGTTDAAFGFKDQSGNTMAEAPITETTWEYVTTDYTVTTNVDVQVWGTGGGGVVIDNIRAGLASQMNWITGWLVNGTHPSNITTDHLGGEGSIRPASGEVDGGNEWFVFESPDGYINLRDAIEGTPENCTTYAFVYVHSAQARNNVNLLVGSDDGVRVWLNGSVVHTNNDNRDHDYFAPDEDQIEGLNLQQGENQLLVKVRNSTDSYSFSARFADDFGNEIPGLVYSTEREGAAPVFEMIGEAREGGQNYQWYREEGDFANWATEPDVPGITQGLGTRWGSSYVSVAGLKRGIFEPDFPAAGRWAVYTAWPTSANRRANILYTIVDAQTSTDYIIDQSTTGNAWVFLGEHIFDAGEGSSITISNEEADVSGNMYVGAIRLVPLEIFPDTEEPEAPAVLWLFN
ncbi:MAG: N-acetylmuramoyl-L-alanine amidase, partial [Candidatus Sumerlaeia bacterium]|nr:N-acetylmuramoyl-L-alanine amidase [Candidatus Sumerlaeia bacterium]